MSDNEYKLYGGGFRSAKEVLDMQAAVNRALDIQMEYWKRPATLMMGKISWWVRVQLFFYRNWWKLTRGSAS